MKLQFEKITGALVSQKNHKLQAGLFLFLMLVLGSCMKTDFFPCVRGTGPIIEESRTSSALFSGIDLMIHAQVFVAKADEFEVTIEAPHNLLPHISTEVVGNTLLVKNDRCIRNRIHEIQVYINMPEIERLNVSGSGTIALQDVWETENLTLNISGSGKVSGAFNATNINTRISGSGDVDISGSTSNHNIIISGSGRINSYNLECNAADVRISGSGHAYLNATESIYARISGSGNIFYRGNPNNVNANISGTGKIIKQ